MIDPVLGCYVLLGIKWDVFQAHAVRVTWWCPNVMDCSGLGTGKSLRVWALAQLRAMLIPGQQIVVYYQDFQATKDIFFRNYQNFGSDRAPLFCAQKGRLDEEGMADGKADTRGSACYQQHFKNGSCIYGPAPNWLQGARGQAGRTFHVAFIDEWTKVETMTPSKTRLTGSDGNLIGGIDQQIIGRIRAPSFNQHHMLWGNHIVFTATAESTQHPGYARYRQFQREVANANPNYAIIHGCFKDFSNVRTETGIGLRGEGAERRLCATPGKAFKEQVPNWNAIKMLKGRSRAHFLREALGLWARDTQGFYSEDALARCVAAGILAGTEPETQRSGNPEEGRYYFMGVDPAPAQKSKSDDGAMAVLRLRARPGLGRAVTSVSGDWLFEFVWAYRVRGQVRPGAEEAETMYAQRSGDWSGLIHAKHLHFNLAGILMDSQGGGQLIWPELNKGRQRIAGADRAVTPIAAPGEGSVGHAHYILMLFLREYLDTLWPALAPGGDSLYTSAHLAFRDAVEHGEILFPRPYNERPASETSMWSDEQRWALKNMDTARGQLCSVQVATKENGEWDLTRNGAMRFSSGGKKDIAYAMLYAYVRALVWLKMGELEFSGGEDDGEEGCFEL